MTTDELELIIKSNEWIPLGKGTWNKTFVSKEKITIEGFTQQWVLKKPIKEEFKLSSPRRAIRKWTQLNAQFPAYQVNNTWITPYFGNIRANDDQIVKKVVDIYQRTKNIVLDAYVMTPSNINFLSYQNEAICVDVDQSIRRGSDASEDHLTHLSGHLRLIERLDAEITPLKKTMSVIKTLLYLDDYFVFNEPRHAYITLNIIELLHEFRSKNIPISLEIVDTLIKIDALNLLDKLIEKNTSVACIKKLTRLLQENAITPTDVMGIINENLWDFDEVSQWPPNQFYSEVRTLIENYPLLLNTIGDSGFSLLHIATMCNDKLLICYLIHKEANLNLAASSTIKEYSTYCFPKITPLDIALSLNSKHSMDIIELLMQHGAKLPKAIQPLLKQNNSRYFKLKTIDLINQVYLMLESFSFNESNLSKDVKKNVLAMIKQYPYVLTWRLSRTNDTLLHSIFKANQSTIIHALIAQPTWQTLSNLVSVKHWSLFDTVASRGLIDYYDALKHLAKDPADWSFSLALSARAGHLEFTKKLLEEGVSPDGVNYQYTPLLLAASNRQGAICHLLLEAGADFNRKDKTGKTAQALWPKSAGVNPMSEFFKQARPYLNSHAF